jgi:hypothetical protein
VRGAADRATRISVIKPMAYSDFTLRTALERFGLTSWDVPDLLGDVPAIEPLILRLIPLVAW